MNTLRGHGAQMVRQPFTPSQRQNAVRLYEDGDTIDAVAAQLGVLDRDYSPWTMLTE